jgi:hypothetical protein
MKTDVFPEGKSSFLEFNNSIVFDLEVFILREESF